jgi:hypothetical protein
VAKRQTMNRRRDPPSCDPPAQNISLKTSAAEPEPQGAAKEPHHLVGAGAGAVTRCGSGSVATAHIFSKTNRTESYEQDSFNMSLNFSSFLKFCIVLQYGRSRSRRRIKIFTQSQSQSRIKMMRLRNTDHDPLSQKNRKFRHFYSNYYGRRLVNFVTATVTAIAAGRWLSNLLYSKQAHSV